MHFDHVGAGPFEGGQGRGVVAHADHVDSESAEPSSALPIPVTDHHRANPLRCEAERQHFNDRTDSPHVEMIGEDRAHHVGGRGSIQPICDHDTRYGP